MFAARSDFFHGGYMNKTLLSLGLVLAQALAVNAFAQAKGETDPASAKAAPAATATAADKAAAKATRKAEGPGISKAQVPDGAPRSMGVAKSASKTERVAAAKKRKAVAASALKKGEIKSGEIR
jgi:hypothetical protein